MSTRANIVIEKDSWNERLIFYRHSDGYPSGVKPTLDKFIELLKIGKIRDNVSQSAGWLIVLGAIEYDSIPEYTTTKNGFGRSYGDIESVKDVERWKVGAYEPTSGVHGDIDHLYVIDLDSMEWREETDFNKYKSIFNT